MRQPWPAHLTSSPLCFQASPRRVDMRAQIEAELSQRVNDEKMARIRSHPARIIHPPRCGIRATRERIAAEEYTAATNRGEAAEVLGSSPHPAEFRCSSPSFFPSLQTNGSLHLTGQMRWPTPAADVTEPVAGGQKAH
jgi:hypothetical protein